MTSPISRSLRRSVSIHPSKRKFTSRRSRCVLPTRSPNPSAQPWIRSAPATAASMALITPSPRSLWPCQSRPTSGFISSSIRRTYRTTARAPSGVEWPTVSQTATRAAPSSIAVPKRRRSVSGCARVVSSVTYSTGIWFCLAKRTALRVLSTICSIDQRTDVHLERARRAEGLAPQTLVADLQGQAFHIRHSARARARKAEIDRADTELIGQVHEAQLVFDIGVANRGALDAITERLIVNSDGMVRLRRGVDRVPVVDQLRFVRH